MSSEGFEDMLLNWLCFIAELDISNYIIVSDSLDQATRMVEQGHSAFHLKLPASADRSLDYGTIGYKQVYIFLTFCSPKCPKFMLFFFSELKVLPCFLLHVAKLYFKKHVFQCAL